jgi:hypothetical protein
VHRLVQAVTADQMPEGCVRRGAEPPPLCLRLPCPAIRSSG